MFPQITQTYADFNSNIRRSTEMTNILICVNHRNLRENNWYIVYFAVHNSFDSDKQHGQNKKPH